MLLNNTGYSIGDKYLGKLMGKVQREAVIRSDRKKRNERLAEVRERHRVHMRFLQQVIYWKPEFLKEYGLARPSLKERIAAIKCMSQMDVGLMKAEILTGAFDPDGPISIELSEERVLRTVRIEQGEKSHSV